MTTMSKKSQRGGKVTSKKEARIAARTAVAKVASGEARPPVPIRVPPELVDRIDAVRDELIPREPYVRWLIQIALDQVEADEA